MIASSSTMPTMLSTGGNDNGFGGGGAWIAVLLVALFAGRGFGRDGGEGNAELNGRFNSLENQISAIDEKAAIRENYKETCDTNMNVTQQAFDLSKEIMQNRFDTAIEFKNSELRAADCCCATNANIQAAKQEILDKLSCNEIKSLEKEIARLERQIPAPSYITYPAGTAYFPPTPAVNVGGFGGCGQYAY